MLLQPAASQISRKFHASSATFPPAPPATARPRRPVACPARSSALLARPPRPLLGNRRSTPTSAAIRACVRACDFACLHVCRVPTCVLECPCMLCACIPAVCGLACMLVCIGTYAHGCVMNASMCACAHPCVRARARLGAREHACACALTRAACVRAHACAYACNHARASVPARA